MSVSKFIEQYMPAAIAAGNKIGVSPHVLLGQWGLETGWGKSVIPGTNNLGNIKDCKRSIDYAPCGSCSTVMGTLCR